ncbi:hypothetical protein MKZ38_000309 [Zalerion maritima]|uniref:Uncharacterized protein n=1 Tax=Zalerion maritima TaxID=339359 RepID=A0AAD5RTA8_9PEZI|nr:hypothetical protein MKZ38_000309 [Zalerion maritima]
MAPFSLTYLISRDEGVVEAPVDCDVAESNFDSRQNLRIGSIFVVFAGSLLGALSPILIHRLYKQRHNNSDPHRGVLHWVLFFMKYFGSGVIIGTAWMHLMVPAEDALRDPCLAYRLGDYDWAMVISLMTIILMIGMEMGASQLDIFGANTATNVHGDHGHDDRTQVALDQLHNDRIEGSIWSLKDPNSSDGSSPSGNRNVPPPLPSDDVEASTVTPNPERCVSPTPTGAPPHVNYSPGGQGQLPHQNEHHASIHANLAAQMTSIAILEFGIIFHSVFIGLALALSGDFIILFIVLVFHQTFEGMGLGSRLASLTWPRRKWWLPYALAVGYALSTPSAITIGLGIKEKLDVSSPDTLLVNGIFDAVSGGILMYTGLVELLAHDLMFNPAMRREGGGVQFSALLCVCLGAAAMSILAKWG